MKTVGTPSKTGYFLIELLIVIAFFAVASTMCVQVFVRAHLISVGSRDLNRAVIAAQSAAESFKATGGDPTEMARLLDGNMERDEAVVVFYDSGWQQIASPREDGYLVRIRTEGEGLVSADIAVYKGLEEGPEEAIYTLAAKSYTG